MDQQQRLSLSATTVALALALLTAVAGASLIASAAHAAQPGDLDRSFAGDGRKTTDFGAFDSGSAAAIAPGGKIVVVGATEMDREPPSLAVARYLPNGALDRSFSRDGRLILRFGGFGGASTAANAVAVRGDKIIVAGVYDSRRDDGDMLVLRLNANGSFDRRFSDDGRVRVDFDGRGENASGLAIDARGRLVLGGTSGPEFGSTGQFAVARLMPSGRPDDTFSGDGQARISFGDERSATATALALTPNGKVLIGGSTSGERSNFALARLTNSGALDPRFSRDGKVTTNLRGGDDLNDLAIGRDGKAVAVGTSFEGRPTFGSSASLARYSQDGELDNSFAGDGRLLVERSRQGRAVAVQPDGKPVIAATERFLTVRLRTDGTPDPTFSGDGRTTVDFGEISPPTPADVVLSPGGKILVVGTARDYDFALARLIGARGSG